MHEAFCYTNLCLGEKELLSEMRVLGNDLQLNSCLKGREAVDIISLMYYEI